MGLMGSDFRGCMKKILIIRIDFLGDMICTTALIKAIKKRWPNSEIHVLANKYNADILCNNPDVSFVHTYVYSKKTYRNMKPGFLNALIERGFLIFRLRRIKFDIGIIPNGGMNKNSIQFIKQLNIKDARWHDSITEFDDRNEDHISHRPMIHECLSGFKLVPEITIPDQSELSLFVYPREELRDKWKLKIESRGKIKVGLFISNKSSQRKLDLSKWSIIVESLQDDFDFYVFKDPLDEVDDLNLKRKIIETVDIKNMVAATSCLDIIVSADSAPVHLGSALKIPVIALFEDRPEKYLRWYPVGVEFRLLKGHRVVNDISTDSIINAINEIAATLMCKNEYKL